MLQYLWQEWQIGYRPVVFQAVGIKTGLFQQRFDKSMFKTLWYNIRWQRFIHDTGHYGNSIVQTIIKDRGGYGVKVTRLLGHFLDYGFYKVFSYKLKLCKGFAREFNWVSGNWSVRAKAASDLVNLMYKEFIKFIRKRLRGNIWGKHCISKFARHLITEVEEFLRTTTVYNLMAKIIFLSLTDHVWH